MELVKEIPILGQGLSQYMFCSLKSLGHIALTFIDHTYYSVLYVVHTPTTVNLFSRG